MSATSRGVIALKAEACTSCLLCIKECPTQCMGLDRHQEPDPETASAPRPRLIHVLDDFRIDFARCMNCGICIEVCPFDALQWNADFDYPESNRADLVHHTDRLESKWK